MLKDIQRPKPLSLMKRRMLPLSSRGEKVLKWTVDDVWFWFQAQGFADHNLHVELIKRKISGEKFLMLNEGQVRFLTQKVQKPLSWKQRLLVRFQAYQTHCYIKPKHHSLKENDHNQRISTGNQELSRSTQFSYNSNNRYNSRTHNRRQIRINCNNQIRRRNGSRNRNSTKKDVIPRLIVDYDTPKSGDRWSENEFRDAWYAHYCQNKSYLSVAKLLGRTETAILTKCNLLKRAILENKELDTSQVYKPYFFKGHYLEIIKEQAKIEQEMRSQHDRMDDAPLSSLTNYYSKNERKKFGFFDQDSDVEME